VTFSEHKTGFSDPPNKRINATVRPVTPLAKSASVAPSRPARYALRWTDKRNSNVSEFSAIRPR
jgi:hypothetical protein